MENTQKERNYIELVAQYEARLKEVLKISEGDYTPLQKKLITQRLKNEILQDFQSEIGKDLFKTIDTHLKILKDSDLLIDKEQDTFDLFDLMKLEYHHSWLILGHLSLGSLYFFAARAKTGKTDFMNYLVKCIVSRNSFLDAPCKNGNVLWYHLEENRGSIQRKGKRHGFYELSQDRNKLRGKVTVVRSLDLANDYHKLERQVEETKPVLVIIDTVRASMSRSGLDEKNANFADIFYRVQALAAEKDVCIVALHHTNKKSSNGENSDPLDRVSGTSKLAGIGEGTIILERENSRSYLYYVTRDIGRKKVEIRRRKRRNGALDYIFVQEHGNDSDRLQNLSIIKFLLENGKTESRELQRVFSNSLATNNAIETLQDQLIVDANTEGKNLYYSLPPESCEMWRNALEELEGAIKEEMERAAKEEHDFDEDTRERYGTDTVTVQAVEIEDQEGQAPEPPPPPPLLPGETEVKSEVKTETHFQQTSLLGKDMKAAELAKKVKQTPPKFHRKMITYKDQKCVCSVYGYNESNNAYQYVLRNLLTGAELPGNYLEEDIVDAGGTQKLLQSHNEG